MKKLYLIISVLFSLASLAQGQFVFDASYNPKVGDKYNITMLDTIYSEGKSGSNVLWDFSSSLTNIDQTLTLIAPEEAFTIIPKTTVVASDGGDNSSFYQANNSSLTLVGNSVIYDNALKDMEYTNPQLLWTYPFKFNTINKDDFSGFCNLVFSGIQVKVYRNGKSTATFDGFGKIKFNASSTEDAIRIKLVESIIDSMQFTSGIKKIYNISKTSYIFYLKNARYPAIEVVYTKTDIIYLGSTTTTKTKTVIKYMIPNAVGVGVTVKTGNNVQFYSTAAGIVIQNSNSTSYLVYTIEGKQLGVFQTTLAMDGSRILPLPQSQKLLYIQGIDGQAIGRIFH